MRKRHILLGIGATFLLLTLTVTTSLTRSRTTCLTTGGTSVTATRTAGMPWDDKIITVKAGATNQFDIQDGIVEYPMLLYSFSDGQRFLCVYDDDISVLVFVVDFRASTNDVANQPLWPPSGHTREYLGWAFTNVVRSVGSVRLPSYLEVQEVASNVAPWKPSEYRASSFPYLDAGVYRGYVPKKFILMALATNRTELWPTK